MSLDWVPQLEYGQVLTLVSQPASHTGAALLLELPPVGNVTEFEEADSLRVERIVGQVRFEVSAASVGSNALAWGISPFQADQDAAVPQVPWDTATAGASFVDNPLAQNLRHWHLRTHLWTGAVLTTQQDGSSATDQPELHPWHYVVDIRPKQRVGQQANLWPCLWFSVRSSSGTTTVRVTGLLRLLLRG